MKTRTFIFLVVSPIVLVGICLWLFSGRNIEKCGGGIPRPKWTHMGTGVDSFAIDTGQSPVDATTLQSLDEKIQKTENDIIAAERCQVGGLRRIPAVTNETTLQAELLSKNWNVQHWSNEIVRLKHELHSLEVQREHLLQNREHTSSLLIDSN